MDSVRKLYCYGYFYIKKNESVKIIVNNDIIKYYLWLINRRYYSIEGCGTFLLHENFAIPKYNAHITIVNKKIHGWNSYWNSIEEKYNNRTIWFSFDPSDLRIGGQTKSFKNWYIPIQSIDINKIKNEFNIKDSSGYLGEHLTICSTKNYINNLEFRKVCSQKRKKKIQY